MPALPNHPRFIGLHKIGELPLDEPNIPLVLCPGRDAYHWLLVERMFRGLNVGVCLRGAFRALAKTNNVLVPIPQLDRVSIAGMRFIFCSASVGQR